MSMRARFFWVGGVSGGCARAADGDAGAPPVEGDEPGAVGSDGRVMSMTVLPSAAAGRGALRQVVARVLAPGRRGRTA